MPNYNSVILIGNITRLEIKYTPKGTPVTELGLAVNRAWKDDKGNKHEEVVFVDVTLWNRLAEVVSEFCQKGDPLFIQGRLVMDQWDDKETGKKRQKLKVVGETVQFLKTKSKSESTTEPECPSVPSGSASGDSAEDIPF